MRPAKAILLVPKVVEAIQGSTNCFASTVDCGPDGVRVFDVETTFDCTLIVAGGTRTVRVLVEIVEGRVSFKET